jgi:shikimate kinase/3-dehydroquinate synthase
LAALAENPALVFVGFMGAGKSTVARAAAQAAGLETVDADEMLELQLGTPIDVFFDEHGEEEFRKREAEMAGGLLEGAEGGAIALGGGAVQSDRVREALQRHLVVWLDVTAEDAWERARNGARPLARDRVAFDRLHAERQSLYAAVADAVLPARERDTVATALPAVQALRDLPAGTRLIWATSASGEYPIYVGEKLLGLGLGAGWWPLEGRRFCVTDANVAPLYRDSVAPLAATIAIEPGEESKTLASAEHVWRSLAAAGMTRDDHVVALGGGVVGDVAGFCAATYQRGVPIVQLPTTLVGQVDAAIGGKTGVDLPEAKNYVGAYHLPSAVLCDTATLRTLPAEELAAGFVEVIKTGLLAGGALWGQVKAIKSLGDVDPAEFADIVFACARYKVDICAEDERDAGRRAVLNLGHTVGHAIEAATGYGRYRHGEAVGLGLLAALRLSGAPELRAEVEELLGRHNLPTRLDPEVDVDRVLGAVDRDKKRDAGGHRFVLIERPGRPHPGERVPDGEVRVAVEELRGAGPQ